MKFCYIDESGTKGDHFMVMVAVIVDTQRMRPTKDDWINLLESFSKALNKKIKEIHTRDLYSGNDIWRKMDAKDRKKAVEKIINWFKERKHRISFSIYRKNNDIKDLRTPWVCLATHLILSLQKNYQKDKKNKGNFLLIFDEHSDKKKLINLLENPPEYLGEYYNKKKSDKHFNQLIDMPLFGDSENFHLIQIADLFAYFIKRYVEIKENKKNEKYKGELDIVFNFVENIIKFSVSKENIFSTSKRNNCVIFFSNNIPNSIKKLY